MDTNEARAAMLLFPSWKYEQNLMIMKLQNVTSVFYLVSPEFSTLLFSFPVYHFIKSFINFLNFFIIFSTLEVFIPL
jgi:hypothetical protein